MFPLIDSIGFSTPVNFTLAFALGIGMGFFLEKAGFANSVKLAMQFYFRDLTVFKVMFTAIITAMTGLVLLSSFGLLDQSLIYINPTYLWPGIVGGLIMGAGFVVGGYCPGTALVGITTLKVDAMVSVAGGMFGMVVFAEMFSWDKLQAFFSQETPGFSGQIYWPEFLGIRPGLVALAVVMIALAGFWASEWAERRYKASAAQ